MLTKRVYGVITNNNDLRNLEQEATENGGHAVGITKPGTLYKLDPDTRKAVQITPTEAAEILEVAIEEIEAYVLKRGHYELPEVVLPEPEPEAEPEVVEPEVAAEPEPQVEIYEEPEADEQAEAEDEYEEEEYEAEDDEQSDAEDELEGPRQGLARVNKKLEKLADSAEDSNVTLIEILTELQAIHGLLIRIDSKLLD